MESSPLRRIFARGGDPKVPAKVRYRYDLQQCVSYGEAPSCAAQPMPICSVLCGPRRLLLGVKRTGGIRGGTLLPVNCQHDREGAVPTSRPSREARGTGKPQRRHDLVARTLTLAAGGGPRPPTPHSHYTQLEGRLGT